MSLEMRSLNVWGGLECTFNRVGDHFFDQIERCGYKRRHDDSTRIAGLGIKALRFPLLWEKIAPGGPASADWTWLDQQLPALRAAGIEVIAGLVHHGSGPAHTNLLDPAFAGQLADYAGAVAARYPWIDAWTPVNEPLTTARFAGLYGLWYPHERSDTAFVTALLHQCRAIVLSMAAIRMVNPNAKLVQTDDLGKSWGTTEMATVVDFYNERRWLGWDLLCGKVSTTHALWKYLIDAGAAPNDVLWFSDNPCPPDIIGINYYVTSDRWLDHRTERFPDHAAGSIDGRPSIDIDTTRSMSVPIGGVAPLLLEAWRRYRLPLAITEAHIDAGREDQLRWFLELWQGADRARAAGADVRAVTAWSLFGAYDWNSLVTRNDGYYESGVFDIRGTQPRRTALAGMLEALAAGRPVAIPVARGAGWWRRMPTASNMPHDQVNDEPRQPILISGANGTLGRAFARICAQRNLHFRVVSRSEMDITDAGSIERALALYRPWAVINASGYVRVDEAEHDAERCFRENTWGPTVLATACVRHAVHFTTFSSNLVFDGRREMGYVEDDDVSPINVYGRSKADAEHAVLGLMPAALVVRTSSFFGPWDKDNFIHHALHALEQGRTFRAPHDLLMAPTYVPDLVNTCLNLIIDGESGLWHLTNGDSTSWIDFARRAANAAAIHTGSLVANHSSHCGHLAVRPPNSTLFTNRGVLMPRLQHALERYVTDRRIHPIELR